MVVGLLLTGCTDATDADHVAGNGRGAIDDTGFGGTPIGGGDRSGTTTDRAALDAEGAQLIEPTAIDTGSVDREIAEAPATEPPPDDGPDRDDKPIDVPQTDLGPGESVLCATVEIGLDAVGDKATATMNVQRDKLVDGAGSISDRGLRALVASIDGRRALDGDVLRKALVRCQALGYQTT